MTKAHVRPRPVRIAYLVEESEHWRQMLEAIFSTSLNIWAGRFNLIVPCKDGIILSNYQKWLRAYDPDILYSYVDFEEGYLERLHETFYPAFLVKHRFAGNERDVRSFRPNLPVSILGALSVTPVASLGSAFAPSQPVSLIDCHLSFEPSLFLKETFGLYGHSSTAWPLTHDLTSFVRTFTIVPDDVKADRHLVPRIVTDTVSSEAEMLECIRKQRDLIGMAQLAAFLSPRTVVRTRWTNHVNLMVGDSFADRILFWNARSLQAPHLDKGVVTLKIEEADLEDRHRFESIVGIIQDRVYVSESGASNSSIVVRSASLSEEKLRSVRERFSQADRWNVYSSGKASSAEDCVPSDIELRHAARHVEGGVFRSSDWHEIIFTGGTLRPPKIAPRHIRDIGHLPASMRGVWAVDLDVERETDHSGFKNVRHHWRLPRRLRLASAFIRGYSAGVEYGPNCVPRVNEFGLLAFFASKDNEMPEVELPSDEDAFRTGICGVRDWRPFDYGRGPSGNSLAYDMRPSDKGRYLTALIRLAGGVHRASKIFLNGFWLSEFERLGATAKVSDERVAALTQTLRKRLRAGQIAAEGDWERIARVVSQEARQIRLAPRYLRFDHLSDRFEDYRNRFWKTNEAAAPREEWEEDEKASLAASVRYLCSREILHQGHEWRCPHCNYNNWISIDALSRTLICEVCSSTAPAPVAEAWRFKLNAFVMEGLRDHGLLANVWCLSRLSKKADRSFYFLEPHELFFTTDSALQGRSDAEFDLMACVDGTLHLCEAKTSSRDIDVEKFAQSARQLRPDVATLAVMEVGSPVLARAQSDLERLLVGSEIDVNVLVLEDDDIDDGPELPCGTSFSFRLG